MLHDTERNELYAAAIAKAAASLPADGSAVDIGTGSSLLACFAANSGVAKVTAFEVNPALARLARRIVSDNALDSKVSILRGHSTAAAENDVPQRALMMTHELLDSGLHSEGLLNAIRHAWRHLLDPHNAVSVPCRVSCVVQPVACAFLRHAASLRPQGLMGDCVPPSVTACPGAAGYLELRAQALLDPSASSINASSASTGTCTAPDDHQNAAPRCLPLAKPVVAFTLDLTRAPPEGE